MTKKKDNSKYAIGIMWKTNELIWVTDIDSYSKSFHWEQEKEAHLFDDKAWADDICWAMCVNGYNAFVVTIKEWNKALVNGTW